MSFQSISTMVKEEGLEAHIEAEKLLLKGFDKSNISKGTKSDRNGKI